MAEVFLISDNHFGHANILNFRKQNGDRLRAFASVEEMDEHMIKKWNSVVRPQDHVYNLGDVVMRQQVLDVVMPQLNGHKRLVRGNHDIFRTKHYMRYFDEIYGLRVLDNMIFSHIPIHPESLGRFKANVHGHLHGQHPLGGKYIDVSAEAVDFTPVPLYKLAEMCNNLSD
jgi:calcineurin-like phosphoesterase family protein